MFLCQCCSIFHVKDPKNYMYLADDPHLKICSSRDLPQKQRFESKTFTLKEYIFKDLRHILVTFAKIADLQAHSTPLGGAL